jgi:serine-type D-Ala-D-Ala carboxypeptidase/endopeptidase (penicillin-binding protein 4)
VRVERTERVERRDTTVADTTPKERAIVPLDPSTHGPVWAPRASELAAGALQAALHAHKRDAVRIALENILEAPELRGAHVGIGVEDDRGLLFEHNLDAKLNPASNAKLCTAMFALGALKPSHRFVTELRKEGNDYYLVGAFDPSFTSETLDRIASELKSIEGELILDVSRFKDSRDPAGFDRYGDQDWQYLARPEALSVDKNLLEYRVFPGQGVGEPARVETEHGAFEIRSKVKTIAAKQPFEIGIDEVDGKPIIGVEGTIALDYTKGKTLTMKSPDPMASFTDALQRALDRHGITAKIRTGVAPASAKIVHRFRSAPLEELLQHSIATSNAFDHEMYALAAASKLSGGPTSLADARRRMEEFLRSELGLNAPEMANASGIGNLVRISARDVLKLLARAKHDPKYACLLRSLARPGHEGTLAARMLGTEAEKLLHAKTGTGDDAVALSGVIGKRYRFTVLVDDHRSRDGARAVVDAIGIVLSELAARSRRRRRLLPSDDSSNRTNLHHRG